MTETSSKSKTDKKNTREKEYVAIGLLRRDTMVLDSGDKEDMIQTADNAVRQGRAQEAFVVKLEGYFSSTHHNWDVGDTFRVAAESPATVGPALNPTPKTPQPGDVDPNDTEQPLTSLRKERTAEAENTRTEPTGQVAVDEGNPAFEASQAASLDSALVDTTMDPRGPSTKVETGESAADPKKGANT